MKAITALCVLPLLPPGRRALDDGAALFPPAAELAKLERQLGLWESSGTTSMPGSDEKLEWTAKSSARRVLSGHWIEESLWVEFKGAPFPAYAMLSYYGWDRENKRYVGVVANNEGAVGSSEMLFLEDDLLVSVDHSVTRGHPMLSRNVTRFSGDSFEFKVETTIDNSPLMTMVAGEGKRTAAKGEVSLEKAQAMAPVPADMARLARMAGSYKIKGRVIPMPGAEPMEMSAKETVRTILGGGVLHFHVHGDAVAGNPYRYEGIGLAGWDAHARAYRMVWLDNMGMFSDAKSRWSDDHTLISTEAALAYGQPVVSRTVLRIRDDGSLKSSASDVLGGTAAAVRAFEATYEKAGKKDKPAKRF